MSKKKQMKKKTQNKRKIDTQTQTHGLIHECLIYGKNNSRTRFRCDFMRTSTETWCAAGVSVWPVIVYHVEFFCSYFSIFFFSFHDWMRDTAWEWHLVGLCQCISILWGCAIITGGTKCTQRSFVQYWNDCEMLMNNDKMPIRFYMRSAPMHSDSENKFAMIELRHNLKWCNTITGSSWKTTKCADFLMLFLLNKTAGNIIIKIGYNVCLSPSWRRNQILSTHYWQSFCLAQSFDTFFFICSSLLFILFGFRWHFQFQFLLIRLHTVNIFTWNWLAHVSLSLRPFHTHTHTILLYFIFLSFLPFERLLSVWHMKQEIYLNSISFSLSTNAMLLDDAPLIHHASNRQLFWICFEFAKWHECSIRLTFTFYRKSYFLCAHCFFCLDRQSIGNTVRFHRNYHRFCERELRSYICRVPLRGSIKQKSSCTFFRVLFYLHALCLPYMIWMLFDINVLYV